MLNELLSKIEYLRRTHKLLILCHCGSPWQQQFLAQLNENIPVMDFSNTLLREQATWQGLSFVADLDPGTMLRELQYAPSLVKYLPGDGWLATVGQDYYVRGKLERQEAPSVEDDNNLASVSFLTLPLAPSTIAPFDPNKESIINTNLLKATVQGDMVADTELGRAAFYETYLKNYAQRMLMDLTTISNEVKLYRFLCAVAAGTGRLVNYASLGKAAGISAPTAKQWLALLAGAGIVHFLQPIESSALQRVAKAPKAYFSDTGLACYLLRITSSAELSNSPFFDGLFENCVINKIRGSFLTIGKQPEMYFFRDSNAKEINLLLKIDDAIHPIEIAKEPASMKKLSKKFNTLVEMEAAGEGKIGQGCVISLEKIELVP